MTQLYWFRLRYHNLKEDGVIELYSELRNPVANKLKLSGYKLNYPLSGKNADLVSNYVVIILTGVSWCFIAIWMGVFRSI